MYEERKIFCLKIFLFLFFSSVYSSVHLSVIPLVSLCYQLEKKNFFFLLAFGSLLFRSVLLSLLPNSLCLITILIIIITFITVISVFIVFIFSFIRIIGRIFSFVNFIFVLRIRFKVKHRRS